MELRFFLLGWFFLTVTFLVEGGGFGEEDIVLLINLVFSTIL